MFKTLFDLDGLALYMCPFLKEHPEDDWCSFFIKNTPWRQDEIQIFGKIYDIPRLQAWYGDPNAHYTYSKIKLIPNPWTPTLLHLKAQVEVASKSKFNSVLLNYYRNGEDSNGWHADNEKELGQNPTIASLSFGESRKFKLKHNTKDEFKYEINLENNSLLIMKGPLQKHWKHSLSKTKKEVGPRINLTFRNVYV